MPTLTEQLLQIADTLSSKGLNLTHSELLELQEQAQEILNCGVNISHCACCGKLTNRGTGVCSKCKKKEKQTL